jgi:preprotein translocase subunit YajC
MMIVGGDNEGDGGDNEGLIVPTIMMIFYFKAEAAQQKASEKFEAISEEAKKGTQFTISQDLFMMTF